MGDEFIENIEKSFETANKLTISKGIKDIKDLNNEIRKVPSEATPSESVRVRPPFLLLMDSIFSPNS